MTRVTEADVTNGEIPSGERGSICVFLWAGRKDDLGRTTCFMDGR